MCNLFSNYIIFVMTAKLGGRDLNSGATYILTNIVHVGQPLFLNKLMLKQPIRGARYSTFLLLKYVKEFFNVV